MKTLIETFKNHVIEESKRPDFAHNKWFVKYHLTLVEQIALELCEKYPKANHEEVLVLVWLHDYGKILDFANQYETTIKQGRVKLNEIGFPSEFIDTVISYAETLDQKMEIDLHSAPLEVQIISSADAASHFIGPFFSLWWYENPTKDVDQLTQDNIKKADKDWNRKMVLPEVKKIFEQRYKFVLEQAGQFPDGFLD